MQSYNYLSNRQLFFNTENGDEVRSNEFRYIFSFMDFFFVTLHQINS